MTTIVAVADGIFEIRDGKPVLLGTRCTNCGNHMFPRQTGYLFDPLAAADTAAGLSLDMLLDNYPSAARAIFEGYNKGLFEGRQKNS